MKTISYYALAFSSKDGEIDSQVKLAVGDANALEWSKDVLKTHVEYIMSTDYTGADRQALLEAINAATTLDDVSAAFSNALQAIGDSDECEENNYSCDFQWDAYHQVTLHEHA